MMTPRQDRRNVLKMTATGLVVAGFLSDAAHAETVSFEKAIRELIGDNKPVEGKIVFDLPLITEDGNSVAIGVGVESQMTESDHVRSLHVFAEANPYPTVASFHFSTLSGKADVVTRIRLAKSQHLTAVAEMNDGRVFMDRKFIKVTIGGCGGSI